MSTTQKDFKAACARRGLEPSQELFSFWQDARTPPVASGALEDERAAFEADTLDMYAAATFNRFPNSGNYNVTWVQDQWGGWQRRAKLAAAAAPNAALVEALKKIKQNETEVFDEAMGEMVIVGLDAEEMVDIASAALAQAGAA